MRHEIKFVFNTNELSIFESWLTSNTRFKERYKSRIVNSIYFDDLNNSSANDNLAGIGFREKYRLRWYDQNLTETGRFELKKKHHKLNYKNYFDLLLNENKEKKINNIYFAKLFQKELFNWNKKYSFELFPKIQVQYKRKYYEDNNNVRITFDNQIRFWPSLENSLPFFGSIFSYQPQIVELKFLPEHYSYVASLLKKTRFLPKRHSKYLAGLATLNEFKYI